MKTASPFSFVPVAALALLMTNCASETAEPAPTETVPATETPAEPAAPHYETIQLGKQVWMARNANADIEGSYLYEEDASHEPEYGRLYTWPAAMQACPDGYRLPTKDEVNDLITHLGGRDNAIDLMLIGGAKGFNGKLGGSRTVNNDYRNLGIRGTFWTSTRKGQGRAWYLAVDTRKDDVRLLNGTKDAAFSCRCIRDASTETSN